MDFVDIAGLVKGASQGEGLGNKFLGHIREVDALAHVVRCFENDNITHLSTNINPLNDIEIIKLPSAGKNPEAAMLEIVHAFGFTI